MKNLSYRLIYPLVTISLFSCGLFPHSTAPVTTTRDDTGTTTTTNTWVNPSSLNDNITIDGNDNAGTAITPKVAMDNNGNSIIVWTQSFGSTFKIFKSEYRNGVWHYPFDSRDDISPENYPGGLVPTLPIIKGGDATTNAFHPQVAMDDNGNAIITWYEFDGINYRVFRSEYRNGFWTYPSDLYASVSANGVDAKFPQVAMSNNGDAIIVWSQLDGTISHIYKSEYRNGSWSIPTSIAITSSNSQSPQVAMDKNGNTIITWSQADGAVTQIYKSEYRNRVWTNPTSLADNLSPDGQNAESPQVAVSDDDSAVITWDQSDGNNTQIFKSDYRNGVWTNPTSLADNLSPNGQNALSSQVAMDASGNAIIVWYQFDGASNQIFKSEYRGGAWTNPTSLADHISLPVQNATVPQVAMDDNGNAVITWSQSDGIFTQIFKSEYRQGIWTYPSTLTDNISPDGQDADLPQVALDNNDNAVIVWQQSDGAALSQIFKSEYR